MRVGQLDAGGLAMVAEQGAQTGGCHAGAACWSHENDEQSGGAWIGPFQAQIVIDQLRGLRCAGEQAHLVVVCAIRTRYLGPAIAPRCFDDDSS